MPTGPPPPAGTFGAEVSANFETEDSIRRLAEHLAAHGVEVDPVNTADADWSDRVAGRRVFNYTFGFGLLEESARPALVLEALGVDYLGGTPVALYRGTAKPYISALMSSAGFDCPRNWLACGPMSGTGAGAAVQRFAGATHLVVKPAYEGSSVGLCLVPNEPVALRTAVNDLYDSLPDVVLVEEYIDGLDVAVPVIGRSRPQALPAVALQHQQRHDGPFVFDAQLKATKATVYYEPMGSWPADVRRTVYAMALTSFRLTCQRDYARLDCRVTPDGRCYFLEMNANPQLGMDKASFAVSAGAAGLHLGQVFRAIVQDAALPFGSSPLDIGL